MPRLPKFLLFDINWYINIDEVQQNINNLVIYLLNIFATVFNDLNPVNQINQLSAYGKPLCHNILYRALRMTLINVINFTVILRLTKLFYSYNAYGTG